MVDPYRFAVLAFNAGRILDEFMRNNGTPSRHLLPPIAEDGLAEAKGRTPSAKRREVIGKEIASHKGGPFGWALLLRKRVRAVRNPTFAFFDTMPRDGFASWLMGPKDNPKIALNLNQIQRWAKDGRLSLEALKVRTYLHEVSHIIATPQVLTREPDPRGFFPSSSPQEEEVAWIFAMFLFAAAMGDRARFVRECDLPDDTMATMF